MDEIKKLLEKCGISAEATASICESLENYTQAVREQYAAEFQKKAEQAKQICIEETERHNLNISRRVQIFCESRVQKIDQLIAKQSMLRESEAVETLEKMKSILEGISISDESGLRNELTETKKQLTEAKKQRDGATQAAKRQMVLANNVLKRNRQLETTIIEMKEGARPVVESRNVVDTRAGRQKPMTPRRTIAESAQQRTPDRANTMRSGMSPSEIAAQMPED